MAGYKFLVGPKHFLKAEVGVNYTREEYINDTDANFFEGRGYGIYEYAFTEKTRFSQSGEFLYDFDDNDNGRPSVAFNPIGLPINNSDVGGTFRARIKNKSNNTKLIEISPAGCIKVN